MNTRTALGGHALMPPLLFYSILKLMLGFGTQKLSYWHLPQTMSNIDYKPISEIDFSSAKNKKKFDSSVHLPESCLWIAVIVIVEWLKLSLLN